MENNDFEIELIDNKHLKSHFFSFFLRRRSSQGKINLGEIPEEPVAFNFRLCRPLRRLLAEVATGIRLSGPITV